MSSMRTKPSSATRITARLVVPSGLDFNELNVTSLEDININIVGNKPFKINGPKGLLITIFPRNGNLLFILEGTDEELKVTIQPKYVVSGRTNTAVFDKRKQAVINGQFNGTYVLSIEEKR